MAGKGPAFAVSHPVVGSGRGVMVVVTVMVMVVTVVVAAVVVNGADAVLRCRTSRLRGRPPQ